MTYMGEPAQDDRKLLGRCSCSSSWSRFFVLALMLKKRYWKDVH